MMSTMFSHEGKFFFKDANFQELKYGPYESKIDAEAAEVEYVQYLKGEVTKLTLLKTID